MTTPVTSRGSLAHHRRVVVKIGSALLADGPAAFARFADDVHTLRSRGIEVLVVSSGAIALGTPELGYKERPTDLAGLQAAAAAGQGKLIALWATAFARHEVPVAQVLLTHGDLENRRRYLNARHALERLIERGAIPVINENDTVAVDEIKLGDNDTLAAAVAGLVSASLVVLLTSADGLFTADPSVDKTATRVSVVEHIDDRLRAMAGPPAKLGTGGMVTKVSAAEMARTHGAHTVVAPGRRPGVLASLIDGDDIGTLFVSKQEAPERARKRWIKTTLRPRGTLVVDDGAERALLSKKSLLLPGVIRVDGEFSVGDAVDVVTGTKSTPFARGLVTQSAADLRRVAGRRRDDAEKILGVPLPTEVIHLDDLVMMDRTDVDTERD